MNETIQLKEYEFKPLKCLNLDTLEKYLEKNNLSSALKIRPSGIKASHYVGIIKFKNTQFEILPKLISDNENKKLILKNLIYMLSYTKKLDIKTSNYGKLAQTKNPFLEVLIREFANSLFEALKRLTPKNYIREEDNLNFLKGKIKFNENIRYNCANETKFYCEFDEFSENCELNQLFNFVASALHSISQDSNNKKLLKFIMNYYCEIKPVYFDKHKCSKIKLNRNQLLFEKPLKLSKMFIENSSIDISKNKIENITLIWDMNELFEEYIYEVIRKNKIKPVTAQKKKKLLASGNSTYRDTKVDIMVYSEKEKKEPEIIIDTKYKKLENFKDIENEDIYQVTTYCLIHNTKKTILLYPQWGNFPIDITKNKYKIRCNEEFQISFKSVNLKKDLKTKEKEIIEELNTIING